VSLEGVETFAPITPTVFLRVGQRAHKFRDLHEQLNSGALGCQEQWPYMPHLTVVKMPELSLVDAALRTARQKWASFSEARTTVIEEVSFVRECDAAHWTDLASVSLRSQRLTSERHEASRA